MKTTVVISGTVLGVLLLAGCVQRTVYVQQPAAVPEAPAAPSAPPAPPAQEPAVISPGPSYVWVSGYWAWQGRWVWVPGTWVTPPYPRAIWHPGRWVQRPHGYVWFRGYWH